MIVLPVVFPEAHLADREFASVRQREEETAGASVSKSLPRRLDHRGFAELARVTLEPLSAPLDLFECGFVVGHHACLAKVLVFSGEPARAQRGRMVVRYNTKLAGRHHGSCKKNSPTDVGGQWYASPA